VSASPACESIRNETCTPGSGRSATIRHSSAADSPQAARAQGCHPAVDERIVGIMTLTVVIVLLILVCGAASFMLWRRRGGGR
jgi:hypothetical protein